MDKYSWIRSELTRPVNRQGKAHGDSFCLRTELQLPQAEYDMGPMADEEFVAAHAVKVNVFHTIDYLLQYSDFAQINSVNLKWHMSLSFFVAF